MAGQQTCDGRLQEAAIDWTLLWAWGANSYGQLGTGCVNEKLIPSDKPVPFSLKHESDAIRQVGGGGGFSFICTKSGKVFTCGNNNKGQLGHGDMLDKLTSFCHCKSLAQVNILKVAAGWDFMLGLSDSGHVLSWGSNMFGQLGRTLPAGVNFDPVPAEVSGSFDLGQQIDVAAGLRHGLSLSDCGTIHTWGHGKRGQLGSWTSDKRPAVTAEHPIAVEVSIREKPVQVVAGMYHCGLLTESGSILMWGCNKYGQCGINPEISQTVLVPSKLAFPNQTDHFTSHVVSVASGWGHIVARTGSGALYSWGRADLGQLGRPCEASHDYIPNLVLDLPSAVGHACGSEHTLAVTENGQVYSWGWNEHSICGPEDEKNVLKPRQIPEFVDKNVTAVGCGAGHSFCVVVDAGSQGIS